MSEVDNILMGDYYVSIFLGPVCLNSSLPKNSNNSKDFSDTDPQIETLDNDLNKETLDQSTTIISPSGLNSKRGPDGKTPLFDYVQEGLVGLLLGDGSLVKKYKGGSTYFKYAQSTIHSDYLFFVFNLFKDLGVVLMESPSLGTSTVKGKTYNYYTFTTQSLRTWNELYEVWYKSKLKIIPENIFSTLTPIGLAFWLMDDGGWTKNGIHLNTNFFSRSDVEILIDVLNRKYGLKCSIHSRNRIYIWTSSVPALIELVKPHIHPSMIRKITPPNK